ncbi:MAG: pitrilysin family protein [Rikenellaceae bacterium]
MIDRSQQPQIVVPSSVKVIPYDDLKSPLGVPIYRLDNSGYDVVRISLVFRAGVTQQSQPFLSSSVINNITEGTKKHTASEIADFIDYYGIIYDISVDMDYSIITICTLKHFFDKALELLEDILNPTFPEYEIKIYAAKKKQLIAMQRAKIAYVAQEHLQNTFFGDDNAYGKIFDTSEYDNLNSDLLNAFFKKHYTRDNMFVVVSGDSTKDDITKIGGIVDVLPRGTRNSAFTPKALPVNDFYLEKEGSMQSAIKIGRVLFNKQHPDFIGMQIVAKILGGYFGSRLIMSLREDKGYTYGIFSNMVNTDTTGYFIIAGEVIAKHTDDAIKAVFAEIAKLQDDLIGDKELSMVKSVMIGEVMRILDGPFGVADVLIENIQNEQDDTNINDVIEEIKNISAERVRDLARKYLQHKDLSTIVVGKK